MNANRPIPSARENLNDPRHLVFPYENRPIARPALVGILRAEPRLMMELAVYTVVAVVIQVLCVVMD